MFGGFKDTFKNVTGIGQSVAEKYQKAYTKGVLVGDLPAAIELFKVAKAEAVKKEEGHWTQRADANVHLYSFLHSGQAEHLRNLLPVLEELEEIELPKSQTDFVSSELLQQEIKARLAHQNTMGMSANEPILRRAQAHRQTAELYQPLVNEELVLHSYHFDSNDFETPGALFYYHSGQAASVESENQWWGSPKYLKEYLKGTGKK